MKPIEINRDKYKYKIKLFGLSIFSFVRDKQNFFIRVRFLFNIFYYVYDLFFQTFTLRIFGFGFLRTFLHKKYKIFKMLQIPIWMYDCSKEALKSFLDKVISEKSGYSDYYIFLCRSGEFFLLMHHFAELLQKNKSQNFVMVFTAKYHLNICKMFFPDIPTVYIKKVNVSLISNGVKATNFVYKGKRIYVPVYEDYFRDVENNIRNKNAHYYDCLKQHLGLSDNVANHYTITDKTKEKIHKIVKYILNDNFVFVSPETLSNEPMEKDFWENLCKKLRTQGYEIFCNAMDFYNLISDTNSTFLTYEEAIELSRHAKAIIGMRSGFLECLSQNNVPLYVLYTDFSDRSGFKKLSSDKVLQGYSIKKLPNVNKDLVFEYDVNSFTSEDNILELFLLNIFDRKQEEIK